MAVYECRRCKFRRDTEWREFCPSCGGPYRCVKLGVDSLEQLEDKGLVTLGSGSSTKGPPRISTGDKGFDYVMSGGLLAGRVVLLGGFAGTGKTRKLLSIADYIGKTQGRVIYASGEEGTNDINSYAIDLGLVNDQVIILGNQSCVEDVIEQVNEVKAFLLILDSAQEFVTNTASGGAGSTAQLKALAKVIKLHCQHRKACAIIVNQMTGEGSLKGGSEMEHAVDTVNVLTFPTEKDEDAPGYEDGGYRVLLNANKNRGGVANLKTYYRMNDAGVLEHVPAKSKLVRGVTDIGGVRGKYRKMRGEATDDQ